jgi:hypothetical protein
MQKIIIIVSLCLLGIFVHPFSPGLMDFFYRFIVYSLIVYLVYTTFQQQHKDEEDIVEEPAPEIESYEHDPLELSDNWDLATLIKGDGKTKDFLRDQFDIITNLVFPENGWVFHKEDGQIALIHFKNFSNQSFDNIQSKYSISGLIQILDEKNDLLIENNLDKSENLLEYYSDIDYSAGSFMGLSIILPNDDKLFFVFDSGHVNHFNIDDSSMFGRISGNTSMWLQNRMKAYTLLTDLHMNKKMLEFACKLNASNTISTAIEQLAILVSDEFEASRLCISLLKKDSSEAVIKKVVGQVDEFTEGTVFPLDEGITGWVISKNKPYLIEDMEKGEYFIPRYNKNEKSNHGLRSFLGIPIEAGDQVVGSVTLEHRSASRYGEPEKKKLFKFVDLLSTTFLRSSGRS